MTSKNMVILLVLVVVAGAALLYSRVSSNKNAGETPGDSAAIVEKCKAVKPGMSLSDVQNTIGAAEATQPGGSEIISTYTPIGQTPAVQVFFDIKTKTVIRANCGETTP